MMAYKVGKGEGKGGMPIKNVAFTDAVKKKVGK